MEHFLFLRHAKLKKIQKQLSKKMQRFSDFFKSRLPQNQNLATLLLFPPHTICWRKGYTYINHTKTQTIESQLCAARLQKIGLRFSERRFTCVFSQAKSNRLRWDSNARPLDSNLGALPLSQDTIKIGFLILLII
jgi:hypothetical protein